MSRSAVISRSHRELTSTSATTSGCSSSMSRRSLYAADCGHRRWKGGARRGSRRSPAIPSHQRSTRAPRGRVKRRSRRRRRAQSAGPAGCRAPSHRPGMPGEMNGKIGKVVQHEVQFGKLRCGECEAEHRDQNLREAPSASYWLLHDRRVALSAIQGVGTGSEALNSCSGMITAGPPELFSAASFHVIKNRAPDPGFPSSCRPAPDSDSSAIINRRIACPVPRSRRWFASAPFPET